MVRGFLLIAACLGLAAAPARAGGPADGAPALWRVADEDTTIYLFGTIHALPPGIDWYRGAVVAAFDEADEIVFETLEDGPGAAGFDERMQLPPGKSLRARLPEAYRGRFDTAIARAGMPLAVADRMKPWLAAFVLGGMEGPRSRARTVTPLLGVETVLEEHARTAGKTLGEIEGAERQLAILDDAPSPLQIRLLQESLDDDSGSEAGDRMVEAWRTGDVAALEAATGAWPGDGRLREILLGGRNADWAEWVEDRLERPGTVLLAVGAAHLVGDDSLQVKLAGRGIDAPRVDR